jgi:bifunctional non-homologous end joining protein LigD
LHRFRRMLAELAPAPFDSENHIFGPKCDGVRCLAYVSPGGHRLEGRNGADLTPLFPELNGAFHTSASLVLDGELVCGDGSIKSFRLIAGRVHRGDPFAIKMASRQNPATTG